MSVIKNSDAIELILDRLGIFNKDKKNILFVIYKIESKYFLEKLYETLSHIDKNKFDISICSLVQTEFYISEYNNYYLYKDDYYMWKSIMNYSFNLNIDKDYDIIISYSNIFTTELVSKVENTSKKVMLIDDEFKINFNGYTQDYVKNIIGKIDLVICDRHEFKYEFGDYISLDKYYIIENKILYDEKLTLKDSIENNINVEDELKFKLEKNNKQILIDIPFNIEYKNQDDIGQKVFDENFLKTQTKEWIDYRIKIFMKYTCSSIISQTNQNFLCIIRYNEPTRALIFDALSKYPTLPENIIFVTQDEANEIIENTIANNAYLYHVNIDSDNMYESNFINKIDTYVYENGIECLLCHKGYIYDETSDRLAKIDHPSPSIYVYIYNQETYKQYFKERLFEPHFNAAKHKNVSIDGWNYMLIVHGNNLSNEFDPIVNWIGIEEINKEKNQILREWKIIE